ncbi:MAG TPA: SMP-30/gluconolactonase/LRE family protein, partial [Inquilinus sp.]|nr:SMP-30/gluconolactonase/LRE family protein [Inquilinus sp.]
MIDVQRVGHSRDILGEYPVWSSQAHLLYWADTHRPAVRRYDPERRQTMTWPMLEPVGSLALRGTGGLLVGLGTHIAHYDPTIGSLGELAAPADRPAALRFQDGRCDRNGRFWAGAVDGTDPAGILYRVDGEGCTIAADTIPGPKGIAWGLDDRTMYVGDPQARTIFAYDFDVEAGTLGARRVFAEIEAPGLPNGTTVDAEGFLWCAIRDGWRLMRFAPDGRVDRVVDLPVQGPTSCTFGGAGLATLYVTTAMEGLTKEQLADQPLAGG